MVLVLTALVAAQQYADGERRAVVIAAEEFRRLQGDVTGEALIKAMQASPYCVINIEPSAVRCPLRDLSL